MKKSLMILASVAMAASALAGTNIVSKNIAGYGQVDVAPGAYYIVTCNFQDPMNGSHEVNIQSVLSADELFDSGFPGGYGSDEIHVFNGLNYDTYFYATNGVDPDSNWYANPLTDETPASVTFQRGDAFWYKRSSDNPNTKLTISGQVPTDADYNSRDLGEGYNMIGAAYPKETAITNLGVVGARFDVPNNADQIVLFENGMYKTFYYVAKGGVTNWFTAAFKNPATNMLAIGQGAWYVRSTNDVATRSEAKPY
ncbi:MAG: hypothetical protein R6X19_08710 [Kiritimatiellia bacterium]